MDEAPAEFNSAVSINGSQLTACTRFVVPFESWGLNDPSTFILRVSNKVQINIAANERIEEKHASLGN